MYKNTINLGLKLTIDQMLMSNVHLGHTKKFLNVHIKPYLLGSRNNIYILNVVHTAVQFKLIINIIINLISLRQKLLIIKERDVFNFRKLLNVKHTFYSDKK
jgi:ribosomal protein S2